MDQSEKDATIEEDEDWHDQLLQLNTDVAMDFVKQNLEISNLESYCNAREEVVNDLKLQVTMLEGEVNLKLQELSHLQEKEDLLTDNLNILNEMINSKEDTEDILLENHRLLKSKQERHLSQWKEITNNHNSCIQELRDNFEKTPLAQKRLRLQIEVQKQRINLAIVKQRLEDEKRNRQMLRQIWKRREQIKVINFARVMVEYYEMQKMAQDVKNYEKKFKEMTENKRTHFTPKDDIFKVPQQQLQHKSVAQNKFMKSSFELPTLNLSAYQISPHPHSFAASKTATTEAQAMRSNYSLNRSMDAMLLKLSANKRNQSFLPQNQNQKKLKASCSLPYPNPNLNASLEQAEAQLSLPENTMNKSGPLKENKSQEDLFEYISQSQDIVTGVPNPTTTTPTRRGGQSLKSPYFPSNNTSQIISSIGSTATTPQHININLNNAQNKTLLEVSSSVEENENENEHDMDLIETSSFVSMEEFISPPGPEVSGDLEAETATATATTQQSNQFLNNMFGVATATATSSAANVSQTKQGHGHGIPGFSFFNNTPATSTRKKSSQNIFSMF